VEYRIAHARPNYVLGPQSCMPLVYRYLFPAMRLGWAAYWWVLSRNVKATARHEPIGSSLLHIIPLMLAERHPRFSGRKPTPQDESPRSAEQFATATP